MSGANSGITSVLDFACRLMTRQALAARPSRLSKNFYSWGGLVQRGIIGPVETGMFDRRAQRIDLGSGELAGRWVSLTLPSGKAEASIVSGIGFLRAGNCFTQINMFTVGACRWVPSLIKAMVRCRVY